MRRTLKRISAVVGWAGRSLGRRGLYHSYADVWRDYTLCLSATGLGCLMGAGRRRKLSLKALPHPVYLRNGQSDIYVVIDLFEGREYGPVAEMGVPDGARVLDLGANIGLAALYFRSLFPRSTVVCVEPDASNREALEANCAEELKAGSIQLVPGFAAAADGSAAVDRSGQSWEYRKAAAPSSASEEMSPCFSVPTLMARTGVAHFDLVKCDIEGGEAELFHDCRAWIGRVDRLAVEVHPPYSLAALYADLRNAGWEFEVYRELRRDPYPLCFLRRKGV